MGGSFTAVVTYDKYPDASSYLNRTRTARLSGSIGLRIDTRARLTSGNAINHPFSTSSVAFNQL